MTEENKKENIKNEVERADDSMRSAALLFEKDLLNDAISRLYYFLLHYVKALLLTEGFEPRSHDGAIRLFGLHFVKPGIFGTGASHIFSKLMKYREEADYNPSYTFTRQDFIDFKNEAESVAAAIRDYLARKDYI